MARSRNFALVVLFGAALSVGCASTQPVETKTVAPAPKPVATLHPKATAPAAKPATKTASAPSAKPAAKAKIAAKPAAKPGAKATTVAAKPAAKPAARPTAARTSVVKSQPSQDSVYSSGLVMSLGAGDSLGKAVYINDVIIAARNAKHQTEFAEVQPKDGGN